MECEGDSMEFKSNPKAMKAIEQHQEDTEKRRVKSKGIYYGKRPQGGERAS